MSKHWREVTTKPTDLSLSLSLSLSFRFNGHFPGEPRLAGVDWSKGWWRWHWWQLDYWIYKSCKAPVKSSPTRNQHPAFYRPDAPPVSQPTVSKHWMEKYHIPRTCLPQTHLVVFQLCLWPLIAPDFLGGMVAMPLISPLMPVSQLTLLTINYWSHWNLSVCMHTMNR